MRAWRVNIWDYNTPSYRGTFATVGLAAPAFLDQVKEQLDRAWHRTALVKIESGADPLDDAAPHMPSVVIDAGDPVTLEGEFIQGSDGSAQVTEDEMTALWVLRRDLQLILNENHFAVIDSKFTAPELGRPWGEWELRRS